MGVNSLPKTVTRQCHDCDLNPGPSAPESSTLTTQLPSHPENGYQFEICKFDIINNVSALQRSCCFLSFSIFREDEMA